MSDRASVLWRLLAVLTMVVLMAGATAAIAQADDYGEIGEPFGERGTGSGQFTSVPSSVDAFGVDPTDNSVYVADNPNPQKGEYRIQKFSANAQGKYEFVASVTFKPAEFKGSEVQDGLEGIAVEPAQERIYVLASEYRQEGEEEETPRIDPSVMAASTLYAFSTKANGTKLEPATGTKTGGVLAPASVLMPQSETPGAALLDPSGITVDPGTHEVIIMGREDPGEVGGEPQDAVALQRVTEDGKLGARYVDTEHVLEPTTASSPVVTPTGKVYVEGVDQIDEIPANFTEKISPKPVIELDSALEELTFFPGDPPAANGLGLSVGSEGTIYAYAGIKLQAGSGRRYPGALLFNAEGVEEGWTGGQSEATGKGKCTISFLGTPMVAAGKGHTLFVYSSNPAAPHVVEFGPGGTGCPQASATTPSASVNGVPAPESEPISINDKVTLSSALTQANAQKVEWEFGDGTEETVSTDEYQMAEVTHQFAKGGELTVTEKIHTDDLATPEIVVQSKIDIVASPPVVVTEEASPIEGTSATLRGKVNPNGGTVTECYFEYGTTEKGPLEKFEHEEKCEKLPKLGDNLVAVSAAIKGLTEHTTYYFRVVATGGGETSKGPDQTFTTGPQPVAVTQAASSATQSAATLNATVNSEGATVKNCLFDYGTSNAYGQSAPCASSPGSGSSPVPVTATLAGLSAGTTYYFRIVASTVSGTSYGEAGTFTTEAGSNLKVQEEKETQEAEAKKRQEEEAAAAAKRQQEEAAVAAKKHQEEEAAANKRREEEAKSHVKPPTRAQLLAKALKTCKKESGKKRTKCEAAAHKKYASKKKKKK